MSLGARVLAASTLVPACCAPAGAETPTSTELRLAPLFHALEQPEVTGQADAPPLLRVGRAEIQPATGAKLLVLSALGRPCGVVVDGPARLTYRVEDRFSVPVASRNLKRASGLTVTPAGDALLVTGALRGFAIWGLDLDLPAALSAPPAGAALPGWLLEVLGRKRGGNPARDVLLEWRNHTAGYRWATLRGEGDDFTLDVDPRPSVRMEHLSRWRKIPPARPYSGHLYAEDLATQPTSGAWWEAPVQDFATVDTDLKVVNDAGDHVVITTRARVRSLRDGLRVLPLRLVRELYDHNDHRRELAITRLTLEGQEAPYLHHPDGDLLVELPHPLANGETVTLEVVADGDIAFRPASDSYWTLGAFAWYPKPVSGYGEEWSSYRIDVESRSPFVPLPAGEIVISEKTATGERVVSTLTGPMQGAVIVAGKYSTLTETHDGSRVHVSTYAKALEDEPRRLARNVLAVRSCLTDWLGTPYPFQDLRLVEINSWGWGQAPPGVILITKEAFLTQARAGLEEDADLVAATTRGINERLAHEVAHGWFPHVAKVVRAEENWLSESFSDYASAVCLERTLGDPGKARFVRERKVREWRNGTKDIGDGGSVYLWAYLTGGESEARARRNLLYAKGPLVLEALRRELARHTGSEKEGDRLFFTWIRSYVKNFAFKPGETRYLVAILNQMTGKDWQPWFERYVYGTETPELR